jgi:hypothetical protein
MVYSSLFSLKTISYMYYGTHKKDGKTTVLNAALYNTISLLYAWLLASPADPHKVLKSTLPSSWP